MTSAIVLAAGGVTYYIIKKKSNRKKRRAKRAGNGARLEVVVIAGSPSEPITRSISLDLERRGFIVYIICNTIEEEVLVQNESRPDINALMLDIVDASCPTLNSTAHNTSDIRNSQPAPAPLWNVSLHIYKHRMLHFKVHAYTT